MCTRRKKAEAPCCAELQVSVQTYVFCIYYINTHFSLLESCGALFVNGVFHQFDVNQRQSKKLQIKFPINILVIYLMPIIIFTCLSKIQVVTSLYYYNETTFKCFLFSYNCHLIFICHSAYGDCSRDSSHWQHRHHHHYARN